MNLWLCTACRKTYDSRAKAYLAGCGTWGCYVLESSIVRLPNGLVQSATVAGELHRLEITAKVTT